MNFYDLIEKTFRLEQSGKKIIRLNLGETNLPTPPEAVAQALAALTAAKSSYGPSGGLPELRALAARREGCKPEEVVAGPGSKQLIYALLHLLGRADKRVLIPAPAWPAYQMMCRDLKLPFEVYRSTLEEHWQIPEMELRNGDLLLLCNPLNPTSTLYAADSLNKLVARAKAAGALVILDEAYRGLAFSPVSSITDCIRVRSFSKEFCLEGWRVGYAVVEAALAARLTAFNQLTITCLPDFIQQAACACLERENSILETHRRLWSGRVRSAAEVLAAAGFRFAMPQAGIYFFVTHPKLEDSFSFADRLLDQGVAVAPGAVFGPYPNFLRLCINQEEVVFKAAVQIMQRALE